MEETKYRRVAVSLLTVVIVLITIAVVFMRSTTMFFIFFGIAIVATFAILGWFVIQNQKLLCNSGASGDNYLEQAAGSLTKFRYEDIVLATKGYSTYIGQGGSGCVFKGTLNDGTCVAVKRMEGLEHNERVFRAEMAAIGCVQHSNLVRLFGYCVVPNGPRFLVYEFIPNGSLNRWIFPQKHESNQPRGCLPWKLRYRVSLDVARALNYLHNDCRSRILHLDIKPENILLDNDFRALLSDFGLAKLMGKEENMVVTRVRGTKEYLAPEWILESGVSTKSDVYSYGLVLLEMIGGRRNLHMPDAYGKENPTTAHAITSWEYFPKIVVEKLKAGKLMEVVDKRLLDDGTVNENEVRRLVYIALWCIQENVKLRPSMAQVVNMLEGRLPVTEPPKTQMFLFDLLLLNKAKKEGHSGIKATLLQLCQSQNSMAEAAETSTSNYITARDNL